MSSGQGAAAKAVEHEVYQRPKVDGIDTVHEIHEDGGRTTVRRQHELNKLLRDGKLSPQHYSAALLCTAIVQAYYAATSGFSKLAEEAPHAGGNSDPIRLYAKGRRKYVSTQRPRNVVRPTTSYDGWSVSKSDALKSIHRLRATLKFVPAESLRVLYAVVIHPSEPNRRSISVREYTIKRFGYRDSRLEARVIKWLDEALATLHQEYGEPLERAA